MENHGFGLPGAPEVDVGISEEDERRKGEGGGHVRGSAVVADEEGGAREDGFHAFEAGSGEAAVRAEGCEIVVGRADEDRFEAGALGESEEAICRPGFVGGGGERMNDHFTVARTIVPLRRPRVAKSGPRRPMSRDVTAEAMCSAVCARRSILSVGCGLGMCRL